MIYGSDITKENFELLLEVVQLLNYDYHLIIKNLPSDYNLRKLSPELLTEIFEREIEEVTLSPSTDINELIGSYEQISVFSEIKRLGKDLLSLMKGVQIEIVKNNSTGEKQKVPTPFEIKDQNPYQIPP